MLKPRKPLNKSMMPLRDQRLPSTKSVKNLQRFGSEPFAKKFKLKLLLMLLISMCANHAWADTVAVLYPEVREPYKRVFSNITQGVEKVFPREVINYAINQNSETGKIKQWLDENNVNGIVALGRAGVNSMDKLYVDIPTVVGAVIINPENSHYIGITQNPSPVLLFSSIKELLPNIKNIHVVYQPETSTWVIEQATQIAKELGLKLKPQAANSLREGAKAYSQIQKNMNKETDALWLPVGAPSRDNSILQNILATAWKQDQVVFSSNLADVRRGVLFSMYPDNNAMGLELGRLLEKHKNNDSAESKVIFLTTLLKAINVRTAEHIGLNFSRQKLSEFDYVYPTQ